MSEMGERPPQGAMPEQISTRPRMEDMPEFQKLAPEQQEKLLSLRERMQAEAMSSQHVVTRSINEMGFFEGLKETVKPHLKKHKEIMFKDLKANGSLVLSLIPILGEGKGLGTGLFGITVNAEKTVAQGAIKFEPFVRGAKALNSAKAGYKYARSYSAVEHLHKAAEVAKKAPNIFKNAGAHVADTLRPMTSVFSAKGFAERRVMKDYAKAAREGATTMATKFGVAGIQEAQRVKAIAKAKAYLEVKKDVAAANASESWIKFPMKWARSAKGEVVARLESMKAGKEAGKAVTEAVKTSLSSKNAAARFVEGGVKRAAPTVIEATKFGKFHAFFDRWLNLTPDVPVWLSTTTGIMEFLGAHGIDAVPAVMQIGIDRYQQMKVSKDMALDVLGYTFKRGLGKLAERKSAAEVFPTSSAPEAGLRGASSI